MGRKGSIRSRLLIICLFATSVCCQKENEHIRCSIIFDSKDLSTKSIDPDEEKISDISLMIFDELGDAERCIYLSDGQKEVDLELIKGKRYSFRACINFGYQVYADHIDELEELTYYMAYPDEFQEGIPMFAQEDNIKLNQDGYVRLSASRLMSKISLRMDRRRLSDNVEVNVRNVKIGNCPKSIRVFGKNSVIGSDQCFNVGFSRNDYETSVLNHTQLDGKSGEISLYMLENMQGEMTEYIKTDNDKQFDEDDPRINVCSYIEMELEYLSDSYYSTSPLIYRFLLGDGRQNLDIERNCHYRITVCPEDEGLSGDGWRVDKSGLVSTAPIFLKSYPSSYINGNIGEEIHIWCEFSPENASFDVGLRYMEEDRKNGIYNYKIDEDGHGATLTLTGAGSGLIYMEAGEPINDAALFIIEVNRP